MSIKRVCSGLVALVLLLPPHVLAADKTQKLDPRPIQLQILSGDPAVAKAAVRQIREILEKDSLDGCRALADVWAGSLRLAGMSAAAEELLLDAMPIAARDPGGAQLSRVLKARVDLLLEAQRYDEAVEAAKAFYNVCPMSNTWEAIEILATCLAKRPDGENSAARFRMEQFIGSSAKSEKPASATLLSTIKARVPLEAIESATPADETADFVEMCAMGNLLLAGDQPTDAEFWFKKAYRSATKQQLGVATESLARCMRAQDGSVGRANAFVIELRPTE